MQLTATQVEAARVDLTGAGMTGVSMITVDVIGVDMIVDGMIGVDRADGVDLFLGARSVAGAICRHPDTSGERQ